MEDINISVNNLNILIELKGKIDSTNSGQIEEELLKSFNNENNVVLDLEKLTYISSAGLRVILKISKICKSLEIINVNRDVYEVFDMTGFTELLKVKKALRQISIQGKEMIGEGYMGKVYRLDQDTIIKVYTRYSSLEDIEREITLAKKAFLLGVPTAIPFDLVKVKEGGFGSVFELINSNSLNFLIAKNPNKIDYYVNLYSNLFKTIVNTKVDSFELLPNKKDDALKIIQSCEDRKIFNLDIIIKLRRLINSIPESNTLIHGDFHVKNIMMQGDEPLLIDMDTLGYGHPIFEIAAFYLTYIGYPSTEPGNLQTFLGIGDDVADKLFNGAINALYGDRSEVEKTEIIEKVSIFAYAWLADKTYTFEKENTKRFEHARDVVLKLIDKYQTLNF